jgi:hypothetical protein
MSYEGAFAYLQVIKQVAQIVYQVLHRIRVNCTNVTPAMPAQVVCYDADVPLLHDPDFVVPDLGVAANRVYQYRCLAQILAVNLVIHAWSARIF